MKNYGRLKKMIFRFEVEDLIAKINKSGGKVTHDTHAIYASKSTKFDEDIYPLEIIVVDSLPNNTACIIAKKDQK